MLLVRATEAAASEGEADKPDGVNVIFGQTHSVKTIEDIHEVLVQTASGINSASPFYEASAVMLVRWSGTDEAMIALTKRNVLALSTESDRSVIVETEGAASWV